METEIDIAEAYVDNSVLAYNAGDLTPVDARQGQVVRQRAAEARGRPLPAAARRLRLHDEYPVARAFVDTRIQTIYGGTTEIMKEIIGRDIATGARY